jgi:hypothetical protein
VAAARSKVADVTHQPNPSRSSGPAPKPRATPRVGGIALKATSDVTATIGRVVALTGGNPTWNWTLERSGSNLHTPA